MAFFKGSQFQGKYEIEDLLWDGGHSRVWLAELIESGTDSPEQIVCKEYKIDGLDLAQVTKLETRARQEEVILIHLNAKNYYGIPACYEFVKLPDESFFQLLEYLPGHNLAHRLSAKGPMEWASIMPYAKQICDILHLLHTDEMTIVHRDVKPSNIFIDKNQKAYLLDFTYAMMKDHSITPFTEQAELVGDRSYSAPEQLEDPGCVRGTADIYSLALVIGEMLHGSAIRHLLARTSLNNLLKDKAPPQVLSALSKALSNNPDHRFVDAKSFYLALTKESSGRFSELLNIGNSRMTATASVYADTSNMVPIEPGEYVSGYTQDKIEELRRKGYRFKDEELLSAKKQVGHAFLIDKTPVTNRQYQEFLESRKAEGKDYRIPTYSGADQRAIPLSWSDNGHYPAGLDDHPVVLVSYDDAKAYAEWVNKRLPTEAEWERAARGVLGQLYPWGNEWLPNHCNTIEWWLGLTAPVVNMKHLESCQEKAHQYTETNYREKESWVFTTPVQLFDIAATPEGIYDLSGNVWEWTRTVASSNRRQRQMLQVIKGGAWFFGAEEACPASRAYLGRYSRLPYVGFRCAKDIV